MSVEATKTEETVPVTKTEQPTETPVVNGTPATAADATEADTTPAPATDATAPAVEDTKKGEAVVEAAPAGEGVLGYKAPGFLKQFHFSKNHFWFSDDAVPAENLSHVREKHGNEHAAWARETGKGALFFSKRAEDKATPSGMILLHEASEVAKEGFDSFSVKVGAQIHRFEAASTKERDAWIVAFEKKLEEAKALKDQVTGSESYKKNLHDYTKPVTVGSGVATAAKSRSKSKEPKKSVDATTTATATSAAAPEKKVEETPVPVEEKKKTTTEKERSQSRKRTSIFGTLLSKKDEQKPEEKKEEKAEKKAEKEAVKEEKKAEAEVKKEEAKETHEPTKVAEAAEATAAAAVPAAVISTDKPEEDKKDESTATSTPADKKAKRSSVFGSLFNKKSVTSPNAEKTEAEAVTPAKDTEVPPVSETAPKIDEPIDTKPLDTAAVTAPATKSIEGTTEEPAKETSATPATESSPKTEKKGNFLSGLIKKVEGKKDETKPEEKTTETTTTGAAAPVSAETTEAATTETPATKEERPAPEKRRTSLFGSLGTMKKKGDKKDESSDATDAVNGNETKREKTSPLPNKIGGLFRKPSKAVKPEAAKETTTEPTTNNTDATPAATETKDAPATEEAKPATGAEQPESAIIGDVVPEAIVAPSADKVATAPEVKASA